MTEEFKSGDRIGGFTVLFHCGAGGFGQVYLVRDEEGRRFAMKVLSPDRRGERELDGLLRFQKAAHSNLLHIHRLSSLPDGRIFYTMDAADNAVSEPDYAPDTLARRMRERGPLPPEDLKRIMLELVSAVAELHRAHLCHRDVKPENILFVDGRATLADAGAVGEAGGTTFVGTPDYLSPEVCMRKRAFAAADDCYALGKVLYSALTGEAPRKFPSTPHSLDPEAAALFAAAERACTPPGVSAYKFRELLEHPEAAGSAPSALWLWLSAAGAVCLTALVAVTAARMPWKRTAAGSPPKPSAVTPAPTAAATALPVTQEGRSKEELQLDNSIRFRLAGVKLQLESSERMLKNFLARGMDVPHLKTEVEGLRVDRARLEAMLKLPYGEKRRAFAEYKKRSDR